MTDAPSAATGPVRPHPVLQAPPERVYRAFLEPAALCKWLPPHGFVGQMQRMEARVGSGYAMSFTNIGNGQTHAFTGVYTALQPHARIAYENRFDDPGLPGVMQVEVRLEPVFCGTDLLVVQSGIPAAIPVPACYLGWQESLQLLAQLLEAPVASTPAG